jgi:uncharacterized protein YceK|tara:strand:- start:328 stop:591 length:264 start_codon:yes stop_codon:yes gene_type:complete
MKKLNKVLFVVVMVGVITISIGCYSTKTRLSDIQPTVYPSLKYESSGTWQDTYLRTADLPLSFALDTALLPLDIGAMLLFPGEKSTP